MPQSPSALRTAPTTSKRPEGTIGGSGIFWPMSRITAATTTSATKTYRHEPNVVTAPPRIGPTVTAIAPAAAIMP